MTEKRPRIAIDLDTDLMNWIREERARFEAEHLVDLSEGKVAAMLLRKAKACLRAATPPSSSPAPGPSTATIHKPRGRSMPHGDTPSAGYCGTLPFKSTAGYTLSEVDVEFLAELDEFGAAA